MIHPPLVPRVEPDVESRPGGSAPSESIFLRGLLKIVVVALGIVAGLVLGVIIAFSAGLIQITC